MKEALINALQKERDLFASRNKNTNEHDVTISWLKTGQIPTNPEQYELLDAAMNDYEMLCKDYDIPNPLPNLAKKEK